MADVTNAVLDGANYIGVGPTFTSKTKQFSSFPGLDYLRTVADGFSIPAFAIGGIDGSNVREVVATGIRRIAVSNAVWNAIQPEEVVQQLQTAICSNSRI